MSPLAQLGALFVHGSFLSLALGFATISIMAFVQKSRSASMLRGSLLFAVSSVLTIGLYGHFLVKVQRLPAYWDDVANNMWYLGFGAGLLLTFAIAERLNKDVRAVEQQVSQS